MILNAEQIKTLEEAARPLIKWMNENCHPHCTVIVDSVGAELVEGIATVKTFEYLKD